MTTSDSTTSNDPLAALQKWYAAQCDGDWEHAYGIRIETLDNPGWLISIDLEETELQDKSFEEIKLQYDDPIDWMRCWRSESEFKAACGPSKLKDVIQLFLAWATNPSL